jgi:hypothetical protein
LIPNELVNAPSFLFRIHLTDVDHRDVSLRGQLRSSAQKIDTSYVALLLGFAIEKAVIRIRKKRLDRNVVGRRVVPKFVE